MKAKQLFIRSLTVVLCHLLLLIAPGLAFPQNADITFLMDENPSTSYFQIDQHELRPYSAPDRIQSPGTTVYQKLIDGIPLHGGFVKVFKNMSGQIIDVYDYPTEDLLIETNEIRVELDDAIAFLHQNLGRVLAEESSGNLVWFREGNRIRRAWEITTGLAPTAAPVSPTGLISVIDVSTGEVLSQSQLDTNVYQPQNDWDLLGVFPRIVINDTIGRAGSRTYAAPFDAVIGFDFGCSGVLIDSNIVLSARHCGVRAGDVVLFGTNSNNPVFSAVVQSAILPDGSGSLLDGGDVSIVRLLSNVPANVATPMRLIDETNELVGKVAATIGYGLNGIGSQGHQFSSDGRRWGGENVIDRYGAPASSSGSNIISTDFDNGSTFNNTISGSDRTPIEFEATTAGGDSGGPILVQIGSEWVIAGVLSGGTSFDSRYGDISWWTGTAVFRSQIEAQGGEFVDDSLLLGDINLDGSVDLLDVDPFVNLVINGGFQNEADLNQDGAVNLLDVNPFVLLLTN